MTNRKGLISSGIYIEAHNITPEEKAENEAKFKAWYQDFRKKHAEHFEGAKKHE